MGIDMSTKIDLIDIEKYRWVGRTYELPQVNARINQCNEPPPIKTRRTKRYEPGTPFVAAMPLGWLAEAAKLPGHSLHVALAIMYVHGMDREKEVVLTRFHFDIFSTERNSVRRALDWLQKAGLIEYTKVGQEYKVTVIPTES